MGCGKAHLLYELKISPGRAHGPDISQHGLADARKKSSRTLFVTVLKTLSRPDQYFDGDIQKNFTISAV